MSTKTESSVWLSQGNSHDSSLNSFSNISVFTVSQPSLRKTLEKRHICSQRKSERRGGEEKHSRVRNLVHLPLSCTRLHSPVTWFEHVSVYKLLFKSIFSCINET